MATNDIHVTVSDNNPSASLRVSSETPLRSVNTDNGSPYYVGARAYVTQTENGATVTVIDKDGTTTAVINNGADGADGQDGADGADGFSPIASVSKVGDTATISITDANGTTTATVSDGADGVDGQDGADGFSPTATVTKSGDTATITITDKDGTTTASISDGSGGTSVFEAEFGTTTYADVKDAYDNDAILVCTVDDSGNTKIFQLAYFDDGNSIFYFAEPTGDGFDIASVSDNDGWDSSIFQFASTDVATQLRDGLMSALDKQKLDGLSKRNIWYGTCSTSASQSPKAITTASGDFSLTAGNMLCVLFSHTNSLSSVSLQVDGGTSKSAYSMDSTSDISNRWGSNEVVSFVYDGTKFVMLEQGLASTTAYGITKLNNTTTSTSTSEAATANAVKAAYDLADGKYTKPSTGIPKADLVSAVQTSLGLADTALQTETDPTVPSWAKQSSKPSYTASEISGLIDMIYPVGSYYESSMSSLIPSGTYPPTQADLDLLGVTWFNPNYAWGGEWALDTAGRVTIARDIDDTDFDTVGETGGNKTHAHSTGNHTLTANEMPSHTHGSKTLTGTFRAYQYATWNSNTTGIVSQAANGNNNTPPTSGTNNGGATFTITATHEHSSVGGGQAHNHGNTGNGSTVQPYVVVNRWHRVA